MTERQPSGVHYVELAKMRGEIIAGFANLESGICKYIAAYFIDPTLTNPKSLFFIFDLLNHKYLTFEVRKDILKKICKLRKIERIPFKKLEELQKIRNIFAHAWNIDRGNDIQELALFSDANKKNAKVLYQRYKLLYKEVTAALYVVFKKENWWGKR